MDLRDHNDAMYGRLERISSGTYKVLRGSCTLMDITTDHNLRQMAFSLPSGATLATATRCSEGSLFYKFDHHEIWVNPGVDSILVLLCLVAVVILEPW